MEDQVPFKVFTYWSENAKPEVRRFGIEKTLVTSFVYMNAKLQEIFPALKGRNYCVTWKDEEGDDVTVSSDDEVMTALTSMSGNLIKLNVYVKDGGAKDDDCDIVITATMPDSAAGPSNATHFGVMCDGCDTPIVGFRYKCTSCDDFDLCSKCESAGMHPEHCMVRMPTPTLPRTVIKAAIKRSRHFFKSVVNNRPEECPYKKNRRDKSGERKHREHGHSGDQQRGERHHHRRPRSSWLETFTTYMNEFANLAGEIDLDFEKKPAENSQQPTQGKQSTNESAEAPQKPEVNTSNVEPENPIPGNVDDIVKLLEMCAKTLIPIPSTSVSNDASVNTNDVVTNNVSVNTNDVVTNNASVNTIDAEMSEVHDSDKASIMSEASSSNDSKRDESPDKTDDWTVINKEKDLMDACVKQPGAPVEISAPIGFNLPQEFQQHVQISEAQNLYPPLHTATAVLNPKEPTRPQPSAPFTPPQPQQQMQQQQMQQQQQQYQAQAKPQRPTQPKPAQPQPIYRHPKPHIQVALENMLAMGFTNDGGWLSQLLESKDGNIAAVLDLLTPVNPKK